MAYTTPLKVFQSMERIDQAEETFTGVSNGDTVQLSNYYIVKDTETVTLDGSTVADSDYSIDFDDNTLTYTGSGSGELVVDYSFAPYSSSTVEDKIAGVEEYIDEFTNTTYDGTVTVTDEIYDGVNEDVYVFTKRPVQNVSSVELNKPDNGTNPNYVSINEGLGEDFTQYKDLGIRFTREGDSPSNDPRDVRVSYEYGYSGVPADLQVAASEMVVDDLVRGTVSGAMVDGRDNFDPQTVNVQKSEYMTVLERYRIERMENMVFLAEEGQIS